MLKQTVTIFKHGVSAPHVTIVKCKKSLVILYVEILMQM